MSTPEQLKRLHVELRRSCKSYLHLRPRGTPIGSTAWDDTGPDLERVIDYPRRDVDCDLSAQRTSRGDQLIVAAIFWFSKSPAAAAAYIYTND